MPPSISCEGPEGVDLDADDEPCSTPQDQSSSSLALTISSMRPVDSPVLNRPMYGRSRAWPPSRTR